MGQLKTVFIDVNSGEFKELQEGDEPVGTERFTVDTVSDLRDRTKGYYDGQPVAVLGFSSRGDGAGRNVYWDSSSTESDDNSTIFKPNSLSSSDAGRWKVYFREFPAYINEDGTETQIV